MLSDSSDSSDSDTGRFKSGPNRSEQHDRSANRCGNDHRRRKSPPNERKNDRRSLSKERPPDRKGASSHDRRDDRNDIRRRNHSLPENRATADPHRRGKRSRSRDCRNDSRNQDSRSRNSSRQSSPRRDNRRRSRSNDSNRQRVHIKDNERHEARDRDLTSRTIDNRENDHRDRRNEGVLGSYRPDNKSVRHSRRNSPANEEEIKISERRRRHGDEREERREHKADKSRTGHKSSKNGESATVGSSVALEFNRRVSPQRDEESNDDVSFCGPALPPHMLMESPRATSMGPILAPKSPPAPECSRRRVVGPILPSYINLEEPSSRHATPLHEDVISDISENEEDAEYDFVGPLPPGLSKSDAHLELERRALELKLAQLNDSDDGGANEPAREEWMTALPEVRKVGNMGLVARQFKTKTGPEIGDRSGWTDTPSDRERKAQKLEPTIDEVMAERQRDADATFRAKRDAEQEKAASKHKKKHKRDQSLLDLHQKKLNKKKVCFAFSWHVIFFTTTDL